MKIYILLLLLFFCTAKNSISQDLTKMLAEIAILTESNDITESAIKYTEKAIIDDFGIAYAGFYSPGVQEVLGQLKEWAGSPQATVWKDGVKLSVPDAAFMNSTLVHALDLDDIHIPAVLHITSLVVPVAFAIGEEQKSSGREVIEAIVLGIEVAGKLGRLYLEQRKHSGFLPTSIIGGFGAVATSCRLLNLSVDQTMDAMGLYYAHASGNRQALIERTLTKRIQPAIAARAAVVSAYFAKSGITGPHDIFFSDIGLFKLYGADPQVNLTELPGKMEIHKEKFEVELLSFKKYACCGAGHPLIEAAIDVAQKNKLLLSDIDSIEIFISARLVTGLWDPNARNLHVSAQFCAAYQVVSAIKNKKFTPLEIISEKIKVEKDISDLAENVIVKSPKEYGAGERDSQSIIVKLKNGSTYNSSRKIHDQFFTPEYMNYDDIVNKFNDNLVSTGLKSPEEASIFLQKIQQIKNLDKINQFFK